jgi:hypothetical protein
MSGPGLPLAFIIARTKRWCKTLAGEKMNKGRSTAKDIFSMENMLLLKSGY